MIKQIVQAVANIKGLHYVLILDKNGDTHFSDSLVNEDGKESMELFLHFIAFVNKLRIDRNNQFNNGDWEFDTFSISILTMDENTLIIIREKEFDILKLKAIISQIFDEIK